MNKEPKIFVIMGIYNCESTLANALDSILAQTYTNWELVLCDDGSSDGTYALAKTYQDRFPNKVILLRNETNRKLSFALNRCLSAATGELIARMDGDDLSHRERLEKQIAYLKDHPDIDLVGTSMQVFDEHGMKFIRHAQPVPDVKLIGEKIPFYHATILTYKTVYERSGGYSELSRAERVEDLDLYFRFFHNGFTGVNIDEVLYFVREDEQTLRRRTVQNRINAFRTLAYGYRLLDFPKWWLIKPAFLTAAKSLVPVPIVGQIKKYTEQHGGRRI